MKFTARSILILVSTIAVMLALFTIIPGDRPFTPLLICIVYSIAWMVTCGSFGYDSTHSKNGALKGAMFGLGLCILTMLFFANCLPHP